jgi:hypothetical protein
MNTAVPAEEPAEPKAVAGAPASTGEGAQTALEALIKKRNMTESEPADTGPAELTPAPKP